MGIAGDSKRGQRNVASEATKERRFADALTKADKNLHLSDNTDQLVSSGQPIDIHGRTAEVAIAEEFAKNGPILTDWLHAKDTHTGRTSRLGVHNPTAKPERAPKKEQPAPANQTAAERYCGKKPPQERPEPKAGAKIFPRLKLRPNDSSKGGWNK